jgi:hypothetical protein
MTDAAGAPPPKKRSLFKRAAWQDAAKKENEDIFSHSNEFKDIVAEENRRKEEERRKQNEAKRKTEEEQRREQVAKQESKGKRRKVSTDYDEPILLPSGSPDSERITRSQSKAQVRPTGSKCQFTNSDQTEQDSPLTRRGTTAELSRSALQYSHEICLISGFESAACHCRFGRLR